MKIETLLVIGTVILIFFGIYMLLKPIDQSYKPYAQFAEECKLKKGIAIRHIRNPDTRNSHYEDICLNIDSIDIK